MGKLLNYKYICTEIFAYNQIINLNTLWCIINMKSILEGRVGCIAFAKINFYKRKRCNGEKIFVNLGFVLGMMCYI